VLRSGRAVTLPINICINENGPSYVSLIEKLSWTTVTSLFF